MAEKKRKGFWEKFAIKELSRVIEAHEGNELFLLTETEIAAHHRIEVNTYVKVG